jgi:4-amino-4-deoxy-L-arabinose transferase-like glycosyltransferase
MNDRRGLREYQDGGSAHRSPVARPSIPILVGAIVLAGLAVGLAASLWDAPVSQPVDLSTLGLLLAVGAAFAAVAWSGLGWRRLDTAPVSIARASGGFVWRLESRAGLLLGAAVAAEAAALALFDLGRGLTAAWVLHPGALCLTAAGLWHAADPDERRLLPGWRRLDTVCIGLIVLAALAVRLWQLGAVPEGLWFDESQRGLEALRMLAERGYRPIFAADVLQEPTGLWFLMLPSMSLFGRDAPALRLPVALAGTVGVGAIYLLGWELYGRRVAIVASGLAVALVWHLNFSRIALPAVVSLTCDTLALALFVGGLRRESRLLLGLAGLVCGAGLSFYFTSQLMPFVLALAGAHRLLASRLRLSRRLATGLVVCGLALLLAAGPFAFFALTRPEQFLARADAVSVMRDVQNAHSWAPVWANIRAHLLMFQVHGDNNGRHNWSGHPMLDPVAGGLMILGLGLALARAWRFESVVVLGWLPVALAGGIFSSIWDAPQAHRSIDALVPAVLLAALPLGLLWRAGDELSRMRKALPRRVPMALVVGVLLVTGTFNLDRYFRVQQADPKTWTDFMAPQTAAGRQIAALPADMPVYLEPNWVDHPSVRFLDSGSHRTVPFDPGASLPITTDSGAIFISERPDVAARIAALYPGAVRSQTSYPGTDRPGGYGFVLPPEVVRSTRGVLARYQPAGGASGIVERREASLAHDFTGEPPVPVPFAATWTTALSVPAFATYRLRLEGPPSLVLTLDGLEAARGGTESSFRLARGVHALRLAGTDLGRQPIRLLWAAPNEDLHAVPDTVLNAKPVETVGLLGRVYRGDGPAGDPVQEQVDPNVELRVHLLPAPRPYTLEWSGALRAEQAGRYQFSVNSLGAGAIWIDGRQIAQKPVPEGQADGEVELGRGWHDVRIRFVDSTDFSYITALWRPPSGERAPIPPDVLRPWPASRVPAARPEDADPP